MAWGGEPVPRRSARTRTRRGTRTRLGRPWRKLLLRGTTRGACRAHAPCPRRLLDTAQGCWRCRVLKINSTTSAKTVAVRPALHEAVVLTPAVVLGTMPAFSKAQHLFFGSGIHRPRDAGGRSARAAAAGCILHQPGGEGHRYRPRARYLFPPAKACCAPAGRIRAFGCTSGARGAGGAGMFNSVACLLRQVPQ